MSNKDLQRLANMLNDEACDLRILADDGLAGHHKRILGRSAAQLDSIALSIRLIIQPLDAAVDGQDSPQP